MLEKHMHTNKTIKSQELEKVLPDAPATLMPAEVVITSGAEPQLVLQAKAEELAAKREAKRAAALEARLALRKIRVLALKNFQEAKINAVHRFRAALDISEDSSAWREYKANNHTALRKLMFSLWRPAARKSPVIRKLFKKSNARKRQFCTRVCRIKLKLRLRRLWRHFLLKNKVKCAGKIKKKKGRRASFRHRIWWLRRKERRLSFQLRKFRLRGSKRSKRRWRKKQPIAFLSKYKLYSHFPPQRPRLFSSKKAPASIKKSRKQWTHKITIKMTSNNIFCAFVDQSISGGKVLQEVSAGRCKIKITKKRLKHQYKTFLQKFFAKVWPQLGVGGLMVFITAPVRLRKKIILLLSNLRVCRFKSKKKRQLRAIFIKVHRKKCFNGCQSAKRRRKKRKAMRILK